MAFNIRNTNKRLPAFGNQTDIGQNEEEVSSGSGLLDVEPAVDEKSNVVATQSWVFRVLKKFWGWTKFFATESMQVAGGIHAGRVKTCELQTNEAYATKLTLVDPNGRPGVIYINEQGELKIDYDFQNVYVYPGTGDLEIKSFVYRYGTDNEHIASNFVGLTPYELMLNFVDFGSNDYKTFNDQSCFKLCSADGKDELVDKTLLFKCPQTKKIVSVKIVDVDGQMVGEPLMEIPDDRNFRTLTINMPSFRDLESGKTQYVTLVGDYPTLGNGAFKPFIPPFLLPPKPHFFVPPTKPITVPEEAMQASLSNDIFDDQEVTVGDDIFENLGKEETDEQDFDEPISLTSGYEVLFNSYSTGTYVNLALRQNDFEKNKEQYLVVETVDA